MNLPWSAWENKEDGVTEGRDFLKEVVMVNSSVVLCWGKCESGEICRVNQRRQFHP